MANLTGTKPTKHGKIEVSDFEALKSKVSKSQIRSRQKNFPSSPSLKSFNDNSYNDSTAKHLQRRKTSIFSILSVGVHQSVQSKNSSPSHTNKLEKR